MTNTINFSELNPSKVLKSSFLKTYEETRGLIARELLRLRSNLFILGKLLSFPSELFLGFDKQDFFALVKISLTESSLLIITKLITDTGTDLLSMLRFKNLVREQVKQKYIKAFDHILKENKFSKTVDTSKKKVKSIRDNIIAHLVIDENLQLKIPDYAIPFEEIDLIAKELKRLFDALCFSHMYIDPTHRI